MNANQALNIQPHLFLNSQEYSASFLNPLGHLTHAIFRKGNLVKHYFQSRLPRCSLNPSIQQQLAVMTKAKERENERK